MNKYNVIIFKKKVYWVFIDLWLLDATNFDGAFGWFGGNGDSGDSSSC
jgi:hypothetical protein